jgi:hypothetical protein
MNPTYIDGKAKYSRDDFIHLLHSALECGSYRFLRQASMAWLSAFPGDLEIRLVYATGLIAEGKHEEGVELLEGIVKMDPEFDDALRGLIYAIPPVELAKKNQYLENLFILTGRKLDDEEYPQWSETLRNSYMLFESGDANGMATMAEAIKDVNGECILAAIQQVRCTVFQGDKDNVSLLAEQFSTKWSDCLHFQLWKVESCFNQGEDAKAVALLHTCVSRDSTGQVAKRIWGDDHPYKPLWPTSFDLLLDIPIPADVAAYMGLNILGTAGPDADPSEYSLEEVEESNDTGFAEEVITYDNARVDEPPDGLESLLDDTSDEEESKGPVIVKLPADEESDKEKKTDEVIKVAAELELLSRKLRKPSAPRTDGRFPLYVIFTVHGNLKKQYGSATTEVIEKEMTKIAAQFQKRSGWGAMVFIPDDPKIMASLGIPVVETIDPWKLKLALADLDKNLAKKGQMIGALLIVGGNEIVPFHSLPNPTDDSDREVLSDNPYSSTDGNYFIPEWPVGRLPGEQGMDAGLLLEQIRQSVSYHEKVNENSNWTRRFANWLRDFGQNPVQMLSPQRKPHNFGFTAAIWRRSSLATFKPIGEGKNLMVSPPEFSGSISAEKISTATFGYFNLHGLSDAAEWFGQKDPIEAKAGPDYPIALSHKDVTRNARSPQVVYSEACYGAFINGKTTQDSLALRFLDINTRSFVGSTCISYGSVTTPLIGADLLGNYFWRFIQDGISTGEALMQAKIELVREMNKRQGYLDGEDQKTLISFVHYGDPFVRKDSEEPQQKVITRSLEQPEVTLVCDLNEERLDTGLHVSDEMLAQVKDIVEPYLPGIDKVQVRICQQQASCEGEEHRCTVTELGQKVHHLEKSENVVVTISKEVQMAEHSHKHFARVTLDSQGKMVKMAVSR